MKKNNLKHVITITVLVYVAMFLGSLIPISFGFMNPFKKGIGDYETTDLIYSKFRSQVNFDDRIVIVNVGKPDRLHIAQALVKIQKAHPKVIGVDVIFENLKDSLGDQELANAINSIPNLILADELIIDNYDHFPSQCHANFCNVNNTAYVNFVAKPDHSIRYFSPQEQVGDIRIDGFAAALVRKVDLEAYHLLMNRKNAIEQIHYRGNDDSYVHIELNQLLTDQDFTESLKDKIVILGYSGTDEWSLSSRDKFFTPLNSKVALKALPDMFGVVIHANIISMILDSEFITNVPLWFCRLFCLIITFVMVLVLRKLYYTINPGYWKTVRIIQLIAFFMLFLISTILFYFFHYKINLTVALVGVVLSWDILKVYEGVFIKKQKLFQPKK